MKTIGIVGGIGPESTIDYYRQLLALLHEQEVADMPGVVINSLDVSKLLALAAADRAGLTEYLLDAVRVLARAGADLALLAANTPHVVFDEVQRQAPIELVSIVAATCEAAHALRLTRVGLLGTRFTMQGHFYPAVFTKRGIEVVSPETAEQAYVHERYVNELVNGQFLDATRAEFVAVIERMRERDRIQGVILGGTELPLLLRGSVLPIPVLDTTQIHVAAIVARATAEAAG